MEEMPRLLQAMEAIGGDIEPGALLDRIVTTAAELAGTRYAALAVLGEDGDTIGRFVTHGTDHPADAERLARTLLDGGRPRPDAPGTLCVPVLVHGARFGALLLAGKADGVFTPADRQLLHILAGEAGIAIGNARLHEAVRQQARWMDGSFELSTALLSADDDNALAVVAEQARRLAGAAAAAVLEPDQDGGLEVVVAAADGAGRLIGTTVPADNPAVRQVLAGEPVFVDDPADPADAAGPVAGLVPHPGPGMLLPLAGDGTALGALALARAAGATPYSVAERVLATQFAQQAAVAVVLARARRDRELLAVLADRDRIARDLHDLVIQRIFAVGMSLESARRASPSQDLHDRIDTATGELDAIIQEIRTAIFALRQQPDEAPAGLRARVLRETGAAARTLGFTPSATFTGPVDSVVGEAIARNLVAALREGLSNAARHARASRVEVTVDATAHLPDGRDAVRLTVADDGVGLPPDGTRHSGLANLAHRAAALGGWSGTGPGLGGNGTELVWQAPRPRVTFRA
ncbi:GAF domain-containing sensor histidine kinase [Streptomyces sp. MP131-18]|uniref:GAF domain-containing sensor histidine kinase n=1 Tax=Streptomyces sp. MP131-18 TaxID=1857892 RepID=UPI00097BD48F|nr:GAF domain-containing sensor histidine kinase [Streptomyces sp. MP131-18]ONK12760.1 Redox sensor histidine kinase response regulatorDevS [Streptomyces sp. MP131-18]